MYKCDKCIIDLDAVKKMRAVDIDEYYNITRPSILFFYSDSNYFVKTFKNVRKRDREFEFLKNLLQKHLID